jgi:hypothetical protein
MGRAIPGDDSSIEKHINNQNKKILSKRKDL